MSLALADTIESIETAIGLMAICIFALVGLGGAVGRNRRAQVRQMVNENRNGRLPPGSRPPSDVSAYYRTRDRNCDYRFRFVNVGNLWKVYILAQPSYQSREQSCHATHRLRDSVGNYICWSTAISSYEDAREIAQRWAEATEEYIRTGRRF